MASGPITLWQVKGEKVKAVTDFLFFGLQNHCVWWLQPWKYKMIDSWQESYDKPRQCVKKQRHHFANKDLYRQSYGLSSRRVQMWELYRKDSRMPENWCLQTWCWRKLLIVPWTARRLNQSIIKEVNSEYTPEGLMVKLKLQYFGHLMRTADSLEKTLVLGKIEGRRRRGCQRMRWLDGITRAMNMNLAKLQEIVRDTEAWCAAIHGVVKIWTQFSDWTTTTPNKLSKSICWSEWVPEWGNALKIIEQYAKVTYIVVFIAQDKLF